MKHKADCAANDWPLPGICDCGALQDALKDALRAIGGMPDGDCFCFNSTRDPNKPEEDHTGECREARAVLAACVIR